MTRVLNSSLRSLRRFDWQNLRLTSLVLVCLVLGGTSQDMVIYKLIIYLFSVCLLGWTLLDPLHKLHLRPYRAPVAFFVVFVSLFVIYLVPLPPQIWIALPGRSIVAEGFELANLPLPWLPLSLAPQKTLYSILDFIPILVCGVILCSTDTRKEAELALKAIPFIAVISVVLGFLQIGASVPELYIYEITNRGLPVGFFSNVNHQACFLSMTTPIVLHWIVDHKMHRIYRILGAIFFTLLFVGVLLTGSIAGYALFGISIVFSAGLLARTKKQIATFVPVLSIVLVLIIADFLFSGQLSTELISEFEGDDELSRAETFRLLADAIPRFGMWGSGPGTFYEIYLLLEDQSQITNKFVPQAHNDYLSIALELGAFGVVLMLSFVGWFIWKIGSELMLAGKSKPTRSVLIVCLIVPVIHSIADYPFRTIAISTLFSMILIIHQKVMSQQ